MTITQRISLLWRRFSPLEERLLAAVRAVLPPDAVAIFDAQVRAISHVQRLPSWTELDYYARRNGKVDWSGAPLFPRRREFPLARVVFAVEQRRYRATLSCVAGHIFDFGVTPSPERIAFAEWTSPPSAELLSHPFGPDTENEHEVPDAWRRVLESEATHATELGWALHDSRTARIALVVRDYDEAIAFFCHKLHFTLVEDSPQPEQNKRWVVVAPPGSEGANLLLARASTPEQAASIGKQTGGRVFLFLRTDDFWRDYNDMVSAGIKFVRPPKAASYGTVAVFEDLYENLWDLAGPAAVVAP